MNRTDFEGLLKLNGICLDPDEKINVTVSILKNDLQKIKHKTRESKTKIILGALDLWLSKSKKTL